MIFVSPPSETAGNPIIKRLPPEPEQGDYFDPMPKVIPESSVRSGMPVGLHFKLDPETVAYRYISERLRELIVSKQIIAGTKLPAIHQLAKMWKTNYFTVRTALTPLVNEGLLVRRKKSGTFVSDNSSQIRNVGFYVPANFWHQKHAGFFTQVLYVALSDHLEKLGIGHHLFVDMRETAKRDTPWKPLVKAIDSREINAMMVLMPTKASIEWAEKISIPTVIFADNQHPKTIQFDSEDLLRSALVRLKQRGSKSVGFVNTNPRLAERFVQMAKEMDLITNPAWVSSKAVAVAEYEEYGFNQFKEIWSHQKRPDGLFVHPDALGRGLVMAVLEKGVRVPEDLNLVLHYNDQASYFCPFQVDWLVVQISSVVDICWQQLIDQARSPRHQSAERKIKAVLVPETV